jgi:hypothetical protein
VAFLSTDQNASRKEKVGFVTEHNFLGTPTLKRKRVEKHKVQPAEFEWGLMGFVSPA